MGIRETLKIAKRGPFLAVAHSSQHNPPCTRGPFRFLGAKTGSLVNSLDLYLHCTVPSLGERCWTYPTIVPFLFSCLNIPLRRLYLPDPFTRSYLPIDCTQLSVLPASSFQLFVPASRLYPAIHSTGLFFPDFRTCLFVVPTPFFPATSYLPICYTDPFLSSLFVPACLLY